MSDTDHTPSASPAPMPDPDQRILEKKPDEQTHSHLVEDAEDDKD